ncbi:3-deoxy-D-manno-octulosonic acid transferase [Gammaproteobacteria bacterium]
MSLTRRIYSLLLYLLVPVVMVRLLLRSLRIPDYRRRIGERFGFGSVLQSGIQTIWIHAVSMGEVQAALPLVQALRKNHSWARILLTTTTITGAEHVDATFAVDHAVIHRYAPYDLPSAVDRFLNRVRPQLLIIMETELWPNLLRACRQRKIPVILANARLSIRSMRGYRRFAAFTRETLRDLSVIAAQSRADAERFITLGALPERVQITGNIKFDLYLPGNLWKEALTLRHDLNPKRPIWIAASTHQGEEEIILAVHSELRRTLVDALLVLVPRHPERFARVANLCKDAGFPPVAWSEHRPVPSHHAVYLGDTMGHLPLFYAAADAAFIGGSLVSIGGHNPLEAAAIGIPVVFGPYCFNFVEITQLLMDANAARQVNDAAELVSTLYDWLREPDLRHKMGARGRQVVADNRGALTALLEIVARCQNDISLDA